LRQNIAKSLHNKIFLPCSLDDGDDLDAPPRDKYRRKQHSRPNIKYNPDTKAAVDAADEACNSYHKIDWEVKRQNLDRDYAMYAHNPLSFVQVRDVEGKIKELETDLERVRCGCKLVKIQVWKAQKAQADSEMNFNKIYFGFLKAQKHLLTHFLIPCFVTKVCSATFTICGSNKRLVCDQKSCGTFSRGFL